MASILGKRKKNNVVFEIHPETGEPLARTRSGQLYSQGPRITYQRKRAKEQNKDAMVLNEDELSAGPPLINGVRDPDWTTNDKHLSQTAEEKKQAINDKYSEMTPQELYDLQQRKAFSRKINAVTLSNANRQIKGQTNSEENCEEGSFCSLMGGKTRNKKTNRRKRKTNRRKRYSRRRTVR
jgi:hypothetical protein